MNAEGGYDITTVLLNLRGALELVERFLDELEDRVEALLEDNRRQA
jgi:hypothetical protein